MAAVEPVPAPRVAPAPQALPRKLRVGVFAESRAQPRWAVEAFAKVAQSEFAEVVVISAGARVARPEPHLWRLYNRLDRMAFSSGADPGALEDLAGAVPHRHFLPWDHAAPQARKDFDLDVAFALGDIDDRALDGIARYGVWRFYFGAEAAQSGAGAEAMAGYREVADGAPLSGSGLRVRLAAGAPARLAYQSWSRTYPFSAARNRAQLLLKTAEFACRALRELHRSGVGWLEHCKVARSDLRRTQSSNARILGDLSSVSGRILGRGVEKALHVEQWFLAYRLREGRFGDSRAVPPDLQGFTRLMPPKDRYWADPFALERNGRHFVFFEELPFKAGKAHISMLEVAADGSASQPVRVLERDYHLSYPFILEHDGQLYMVPETAQKGTVEVYRCIDFPLRWKLERVLMDNLRCVDATFHRAADRWWMFANAAAPGSRMFDDELHLFHAEDFFGDWQPHPRNPVKSDARCARPAGQLYRENGALYRPAQICTPLYGSGLSINRVLRLTPHEYAERQVERILPSRAQGLLGLHTVNRAGDLTVVDGFIRRSRI